MRILIATQNSDTRFSIELLLSQEPGATVVGTTGDTEGLLALIPATHPDIVIADWALPNRPMQTILKKFATHTKPHFIILSTHDHARQPALEAGATDFVVAGSRPDELLNSYRAVRVRVQKQPRSEINNEQNQQ